MTSERRNFAALLRFCRKEKGWTQAELALRACLSPAAVRQYEQERRLPDLASAYYLAKAFGLSVDVLAQVAVGAVAFKPPEE
jgi:transcriptional regulator with XRE-family HTH domain